MLISGQRRGLTPSLKTLLRRRSAIEPEIGHMKADGRLARCPLKGTSGDAIFAVRDGIDRGAVGFDAIKHLLLCRIERRPPRLDLTTYPYLPRATVKTTSARDYMGLLAGHAQSVEGAHDAGAAS